MQQSFDLDLPELDKDKTRAALEAEFARYRLYKYLEFDEREATITASYQERFHGPTNVTSDQTASIAIYNVDEQAHRRAFCERVERAVNRLPGKERFLITERYLQADSDYIHDYQIYSFKFDPAISKDTYGKIKWAAFDKLSRRLGVAVMKEE